MAVFERYVGIDYSGARTANDGLSGLRVYLATRSAPAAEVPSPGPRRHWSRRGIAEWLAGLLREDRATLVGIDHAFSFPLRYFTAHGLATDWPAFLDDFQRHWPVDRDGVSVEAVRTGAAGSGAARLGNARWRRLTDTRAGTAKSVFHFDVQGSVAKSTHAGLPWLRFIRHQAAGKVRFWPFDGWQVPPGMSVVAEVYPALWSRTFPRRDRSQNQHDAYAVAEWLRQSDGDGSLAAFLVPSLTGDEQALAQTVEGWILGVA